MADYYPAYTVVPGSLPKNPVHHNNTKYIDVRHHYVRECVADGPVALRSVASADNMADICTKPPDKVKFTLLQSMFGLVNFSRRD